MPKERSTLFEKEELRDLVNVRLQKSDQPFHEKKSDRPAL
jgi:hypothetical protein